MFPGPVGDIVCDSMDENDSVKLARLTKGIGTRNRVRSAAKISHLQKFLRLKENLGELQALLVKHAKELENGDKTIITTHHSKVFSNKSSFNTNDLGPCSIEEADYRMMLHRADMPKQNITNFRIGIMVRMPLSFP